MAADYIPEFKSEGTLDEVPLPLLIAQILDGRWSGVLHIESASGAPWMYFEEGFPAGVFVPRSQDFLGSILRELGFIDDAAYNESLMVIAKEKILQGQALLQMGKITEEHLERALSLQTARKMSRLFTIKSGKYRFVEEEDPSTAMDPIRVNPYALIFNGIKNTYAQADLQKGLSPLVGKSCKVSRLFIERKELFDFPKEDLEDIENLRDFRLPQEFVRGSRSGPVAAMMMLLSLWFCGMLELEDASFVQAATVAAQPVRPAAPPRERQASTGAQSLAASGQGPSQPLAGRPSVSASVSASKVPDDLRRKIIQKFEQVKTADLYGVLEVEKDADLEHIKKSFLILAKVYHPDRITGGGDEELNHRINVIASRLNEAYAMLTDPAKRAEHDQEAMAQGPTGSPRPEEAKIQFSKAMVFLKKRDFTKAMEHLRWAIDLDNKNPDYKAYHCWIEYLRNDGKDPSQDEKLEGSLLDIAKAHQGCFLAYRFLSVIYRKRNDEAKYSQFLASAHKINPKDVEVAREIRLLQMRKEKDDRSGRFLGIKLKK